RSPPTEQTQVDYQAVHGRLVDLHHGMQQAALLQTVVRDVLVFVLQNGEARQQGVAMVGAGAYRVAAVSRLHVQHGGQRLVLTVELIAQFISTLHFLQEEQVGAQVVQAQS